MRYASARQHTFPGKGFLVTHRIPSYPIRAILWGSQSPTSITKTQLLPMGPTHPSSVLWVVLDARVDPSPHQIRPKFDRGYRYDGEAGLESVVWRQAVFFDCLVILCDSCSSLVVV